MELGFDVLLIFLSLSGGLVIFLSFSGDLMIYISLSDGLIIFLFYSDIFYKLSQIIIYWFEQKLSQGKQVKQYNPSKVKQRETTEWMPRERTKRIKPL